MQNRTCVYCGKRLSLFLYLSGEPRFCSPDHRARYRGEMEKLALESLLEAEQATNQHLTRELVQTACNPVSRAPEPEPVDPAVAPHVKPRLAPCPSAASPRSF